MRTLPARHGLARRAVALTLAALLLSPGTALAQNPALPQGGQAVQGSVSVTTPSGSQMVITQSSDRAIVNWKDFSIGANGVVTIQQPGAASAILNRVTGDNPSLIDGRLQSNGQVYLLNPRGIVVGPGGVIDTAAFLGSILQVSDDQFMAGGPLNFSGTSAAGIVNLGRIHASTGDVVLLAPAVANRGTIDAPSGTAALVSGREVLLATGGPGSMLIETSVPAAEGAVENSGVIAAAAAQLKAAGSPYAVAVNNSGVVSATSLTERGGRIILDAGDGGVVHSGTLDASGASGGGSIRIKGGETTIAAGATIRADATVDGNGGEVAVLSGGKTHFAGTIFAKGAGSGRGGSAEVSGGVLSYAGRADLTAPGGATGTLLLDPATIDIDAATAAAIAATLNTAGVTQQATSAINVNAPIVNATTAHTLRLDAPTIAINAPILLPNGLLELISTTGPGVLVASLAAAAINVRQLTLATSAPTTTLSGPVTVSDTFVIDQAGTTTSNITVDNAANQIAKVGLVGADNNFTSGDIRIVSNSAMQVDGFLSTGGRIVFIANGNLTLTGSAALTAAGGLTLAANGTGHAFINNAGVGLVGAGTGRVVIYSASDANGFSDGGLGYTQVAGVVYPNDPLGTGNVIYIGTGGILPVLTITADDKTKVYGAVDPVFTASYSGGTVANLSAPVLFSIAGHVNVGTYTITPFGATSATHQLQFVPGTLIVTPAPLIITALDATKVYGNSLPAFTASYSGFVNGDTSSVVSGLNLATTATTASGVGTYAIVPSGASATNYAISYVNGTLTVTPNTLLIIGNDATRLYGSANPALTATITGLVNGDSPSVVSGLTVTTSAGTQSNVGAYAIVPSGAAAENYTIQYLNGTLQIMPAPLTVTSSSALVVYGQPAPTLSNIYIGLVAGDTAESIGLGVQTSIVAGTPVGTYSTSLTGSAPNYAITYVPGIVTVTPAPLVIGAFNAMRQVFTANPVFTGYWSGLFRADDLNNLTFTTTATENSSPGAYAIVPHVGPMPNYTITYVNGTLTVQDAPVVVVSDTPIEPLVKDLRSIDFAAESEPVVLGNLSNMGLDTLQTLAKSVVDRAVAKAASCPTCPEIEQIRTRTYSNAVTNNDPEYLGRVLPFLVVEAESILKRDPKTWTVDEKNFIDYLTRVVSTERKAAAQQAKEHYEAWKDADRRGAEEAGEFALLYIKNIPPDQFLNQASVGVAVEGESAARLGTVIGATASFAATGSGSAAIAANVSTQVLKQIFPKAITMATRFVDKAVAIAIEAATHTAGATAQSIELAATGARTAAQAITKGTTRLASSAVGAIGGAAIFAATTIIEKAIQLNSANEYQAKFDEAVAKAQKPVTASDLKTLLNGENGASILYNYLAATVAKSGKN